MARRFGLPVAHLFLLALFACQAIGADADGIEFFEKKVRPVLVDTCYKCHSAQAEKLKRNLYLDSREGMLKGGDTGPAVVPGDLEKSLLIRAIRYTDEDMQMPPKQRLSAEQVAAFEAWVKMGAPYPATPASALKAAPKQEHWAFQLPKDPPLPAVQHEDWAKAPIDRFVLAKLEASKLVPAKPADRLTLIRRATFDLTGLPPTADEVAAFEADKSPDAFAKVIDRLLASPRYGERWGRYWLDVARYADTKGYVFEEERRYPYSYTYRDWVIGALNEDMPYDRFLMLQIAADRMLQGDDKHPLAALGFLTLGRRFLNQPPDIIDDRIDVVCRGTMALTVGCARCHDHKFDPIPTRDYYSLYGIFDSSREPADPPQLGLPGDKGAYEEYLAQLKKLEDEVEKYIEKRRDEVLASYHAEDKIGAYLLAVASARSVPDDKAEPLIHKHELKSSVFWRWRNLLKNCGPDDPVFGPWQPLAALSDADFKTRNAKIVSDWVSRGKANPLAAKALTETPLGSMDDLAHRYAKLLAANDKPATLGDPQQESIRQVMRGTKSPLAVPAAEAEQHILNGEDHRKIRELRKKVDAHKATHRGAPPRAMAMEDLPNPHNVHVFKRGNPGNQGEEAPRQFLAVISKETRQPFKDGSGRLELAKSIASKDNPLTARVMVNRVWLHHFGFGLVRTPSDFGTRSEPPTHPELLDYLACRFVENGWSIKKLHRLIMLSNTWQQSSDDNPAAAAADPENRLLWHMNRMRLDFEATRDSLLAVSGNLDLTMGGRPFDIAAKPYAARRTVYSFIDRQNLPNIFRAFDFASPDTHSPQRFITTVPQQALFMMNSAFVTEQARRLARRSAEGTTEQRIRQLYAILFQRAPNADELALGNSFFAANEQQPAKLPAKPTQPPWQYGYGRYDEATKRVADFKRLPHFTGTTWQGGETLPDSKLTWLLMTANGGHPGDGPAQAVIRRWTAPCSGVVSISGTLSHHEKAGDGVRGRLVASGEGQLGTWIVHNASAETKFASIKVSEGDSIDFVVDCNANLNSDSFIWAPQIRLLNAAADTETREWNASADFHNGPKPAPNPMSPWERYAQVLLETNEFVFVD